MLRGFLLALCALALFAPSALAAEDEIFVDPDSPSGKEYALPIDRARKEAAPATKGARANAATPLFGEGVDSTRSRASARRRSGATGPAGGAKTRGSGTRERAETAEIVEAAPKTLQAQAASPDGGIGVAAIIGGVGVGVLLLGGAIGMLLRRRASRSG